MPEYIEREANESICRSCFHSCVCEQFNEHRDSDNKKCHFFHSHFVPAADVEVVRHGEWVLTPREENTNYRWSVTAECSECHFSKGEIYVGFFPNFPTDVAQSVVLDYAKAVKLDNYCPNCGADMRGREDGRKG